MADAQYAIEVAANMTGGSETTAQLDEIASNLMSGGKNADFFQQAMSQISKELAGAEAAARTANAALADGNTQYAQLEKAALKAASAADKAAQKNGGAIPPELAAQAQAATSALAAHSTVLRGLEAEAKKANDAEAKLSSTQKNLETLNGHVNKSLLGQAETYEKLRFGLGAVGGSLGQLAGKALAPLQGFSKLSAEFGASKAAAIAAVGAFALVSVAVIAIAAAAVVGTVKLAAWAVGLADSARSAQLAAMAMQVMHPELAGLEATYGAVTAATGLHTDAVQALAVQLHKAKVSAADMPAALQAAALAEAALGKGGSAEFVANIQKGSVAVSKLSADVTSKLGGIVAQQMRGLDAQSTRFHDNIGGLFGGLNIEPVLNGMSILVGLFDKNTVAGGALKFLFEKLFQPLVDKAESAALVVEAFYLGVLIGATKLYIAAKPLLKVVSDLFGFEDTSLADTLDAAKKAGELFIPVALGLALVVGGLLAAAAVAATAVVLPLVGAALAAAAPFIAAGAAIGALGAAFYELYQLFQESDLGEIASTLGKGIIDGLVGGITAGFSAVSDALGNVMHGAIDAGKRALGIASPSKEAHALMANVTDTAADTLDAGAADVQTSMANAVGPPAIDDMKTAAVDVGSLGALRGADSPAPAAGATPGGGGGAAGLNLAGATFQFFGVEGAEDAERRFGELLTRFAEGDALSLGGGVTP